MRMRVSLKLLLGGIVVAAAFSSFSFWTRCGYSSSAPVDKTPTALRSEGAWHRRSSAAAPPDHVDPADQWGDAADEDTPLVANRGHSPASMKSLSEISCIINREYAVSCRQDTGEVYVPFSFLHKYFEVYGRVAKQDGQDVFEWQHSYSKVYYPKDKYDPHGIFLWFENYNVEVRDRVKCISGTEGVPVSTQWDARGHLYPIQIAQFGLSHFSKSLSEAEPTSVPLDNGVNSKAEWLVPNGIGSASLNRVYDRTAASDVIEFKTADSEEGLGIVLTLHKPTPELTLIVDLKMVSNVSIAVVLRSSDRKTLYTVTYGMSNVLMSAKNNNVFYGIGYGRDWVRLTRDLLVDLQKGLLSLQPPIKRKSLKPRNLSVASIVVRGHGFVDNITLASAAHMDHFFAAADWLVRHQDERGGWPIMVTRRLSNGLLELPPGWYSAMGQGQAMSLLSRAFKATGDLKYLESALKGLALFKVRAENHGIMTTFVGKYVWYEEYPTIPSSFVLNGFIYSLIGLYDLKMTCTHSDCREAAKFFDEGMIALKKMLPLFDTGSGSIYDLRHFSLGTAPNLARWDYHTTHINQLLLLSTIDNDPILETTATRWISYMSGKRAPHN